MSDDGEQNDLFSVLDKKKTEPADIDKNSAEDSLGSSSTEVLFGESFARRPGEVRIEQRRNKFYTKFVRSMRIALPLVAMVIVVFLIVLSDDSKDVVKAPPAKEEVLKQSSIGRNELLDPRFDTFDQDGRPYAITAERAFQTMDNSDIIYLEKPVADSTLNDGAWVALESVAGTYDQINQLLLLEGNVKLFHDAGYTLITDKFDIDLKENKATSTVDVNGHGPVGTIQSKGMIANGASNKLIFTGPAKLVLHDTNNLLE